ncbi:MAG: IS1634 family transposase, partial [Proteobacteria bacterium]|nr:IS1634 family transposase [Pseudomonadota bacterium]
PSPAAKRKAASKRTDDGLPVHSFRSLIADLATLTRNTVRFGRAATFHVLATPTQTQRRAFDLLALQPTL